MDFSRKYISIFGVAIVLILSVLVYGLFNFPISPCVDLTDNTPPARFSHEYNESSLVLAFEEGDRFSELTTGMDVVVQDNQSGKRANVTWFPRNESVTVSPGDQIVIEEQGLNFDLDRNDDVWILWTGYPEPLPDYCPNKEPVSERRRFTSVIWHSDQV